MESCEKCGVMAGTIINGLCGSCLYERNPELFRKLEPERETSKPGGKYTAAQAELKRLLNEQQTVSVPKLRRLINSLNIPLQPGKTANSNEAAYLKGEIRKRDKKISLLTKKLRRSEAVK